MNLWILSDLHLEVEGLQTPLQAPPEADLCVIAGDLTNSCARGVKWISENISLPTVYVAGNHEFYRNSIETLDEGRAEAERHPSVYFLKNDAVVINGVRIFGGTLWTDFDLYGNRHLAMMHARQVMNDYRAISWTKKPWERFTPNHALKLHQKSLSAMRNALREPFDGPTVVVSHHCPHRMSIHPRYERDLLNAAFASDLHHLFEELSPDLWVHGHTHDSFDYHTGKTRVVCNPRGYGNENRAFRRDLIVSV